MAYLGYGQISDPSAPELQPAAPPQWMGRPATPAAALEQEEIQKSLSLLRALQLGPDAGGEAYTQSLQAVAVPPGLDPGHLSALHHARSWIYAMTTAQIQAVNPTLSASVIEEARRRLWVPGLDPAAVHADTIARFQQELPILEVWEREVAAFQAELTRYMDYVAGTFQQFQTYMQWMEHHLAKKESRTANVAKVLEVIGKVGQYIPYVGWIIYTAALVGQVGVQVNGAREAARELNRAGFRGHILEGAANAYEAVTQTFTQADNLSGQLRIAITIRTDYLANAGAFVPPPLQGGMRQSRGRGTMLAVGGGLAAVALAFLARR